MLQPGQAGSASTANQYLSPSVMTRRRTQPGQQYPSPGDTFARAPDMEPTSSQDKKPPSYVHTYLTVFVALMPITCHKEKRVFWSALASSAQKSRSRQMLNPPPSITTPTRWKTTTPPTTVFVPLLPLLLPHPFVRALNPVAPWHTQPRPPIHTPPVSAVTPFRTMASLSK